MNEREIGVPIPIELNSEFNDVNSHVATYLNCEIKNKPLVRATRNEEGLYNCVEYYNPDKTLSKKIYYKYGNITKLEKYKNGILIYTKEYNSDNNKLELITYFSSSKEVLSKIKFKYTRDNRIKGITKIFDNEIYSIEYSYDALYRVNSRIIKVNNKIIDEEKFKFDIFERIVEYQNNNISIYILERRKNLQLCKYKIIDNEGNELFIHNKFNEKEDYINTEVILNGQKTVTKNVQYLDNKYLKNPYTSPEDLELIISRYTNETLFINNSDNLLDFCKNKNENNILPITIRKLQLCKTIKSA